MPEQKKILKLRLSLKGRPMKSYTFDKETVTVGRSPDCDVFLDNAGVSREHMRIIVNQHGHYEAIDLGSANGTLINDKPLSRAYLTHEDIVQIGKFMLWVGLEEDRRGEEEDRGGALKAASFENTTVLSTDELEHLMARTRDKNRNRVDVPGETASEDRDPDQSPVTAPSRSALVAAILIAFFLGTAAGISTLRFLAH